MKVSIAALVSLLASVGVARPQAKQDGDPLPQTSRVTAFVIGEDGTPSVECWEIANMMDSQHISRVDGSRGEVHSVSLAAADELDGVDILTWPAYAPIWPASDDAMRTEAFDLSIFCNLFSVQSGLISLNARVRIRSDAVAEEQQWVFDMENGDDWFYFEDNYSSSSLARGVDAAPSPFTVSTVSGTEAEVLRLRFPQQPKHKVLHKGGCSFSGVSSPTDSSQEPASRVRNSLVQQQGIHDL